jgi:hypothetical protein
MKIRFLYSADCPSYEDALHRLRSVLEEEGVAADVEILRVDTVEEAQRERFVGSPTIIVDGHDICPTEDSRYGLACRAYALEDGRVSPLPSLAMIRRAIRAATDDLKSIPKDH